MTEREVLTEPAQISVVCHRDGHENCSGVLRLWAGGTGPCRCSCHEPERDERIQAWERIVKHPLFADCFQDGVLLHHMLNKLDRINDDQNWRARVWREGYYTGMRDYAASMMGAAAVSTPNPYDYLVRGEQ